MKWGAIIVLTVSVAATPTYILAECAWVLWIKEHSELPVNKDLATMKESIRWEIHSAVETRRECAVNQEALWKVVSTEGEGAGIEKADLSFPAGIFRHLKNGGFHNTTLHCLPDTVNPHGN